MSKAEQIRSRMAQPGSVSVARVARELGVSRSYVYEVQRAQRAEAAANKECPRSARAMYAGIRRVIAGDGNGLCGAELHVGSPLCRLVDMDPRGRVCLACVRKYHAAYGRRPARRAYLSEWRRGSVSPVAERWFSERGWEVSRVRSGLVAIKCAAELLLQCAAARVVYVFDRLTRQAERLRAAGVMVYAVGAMSERNSSRGRGKRG